MKKRDVAIAVWMLLCAVAPATQIDWTVAIATFATLLFLAGWQFGGAFGQWAAEKQQDLKHLRGIVDVLKDRDTLTPGGPNGLEE